jgi:hypothetical protein
LTVESVMMSINMNLQEHISRIQSMMGVITENEDLINRILDKITDEGYDSLTKSEKQYLDNKSKGVNDDDLEDIINIDSGYRFNDTIDGIGVTFTYDETEQWDEDPVEYKHMGELIYDGEELDVTMYTDEDLNVHSFDLHDGNDYVQLDDVLEDQLFEFFKNVGDKIKQSIM